MHLREVKSDVSARIMVRGSLAPCDMQKILRQDPEEWEPIKPKKRCKEQQLIRLETDLSVEDFV